MVNICQNVLALRNLKAVIELVNFLNSMFGLRKESWNLSHLTKLRICEWHILNSLLWIHRQWICKVLCGKCLVIYLNFKFQLNGCHFQKDKRLPPSQRPPACRHHHHCSSTVVIVTTLTVTFTITKTTSYITFWGEIIYRQSPFV